MLWFRGSTVPYKIDRFVFWRWASLDVDEGLSILDCMEMVAIRSLTFCKVARLLLSLLVSAIAHCRLLLKVNFHEETCPHWCVEAQS